MSWPEGVERRDADSFLGEVSTERNRLRLMAYGDGVEVIRHDLSPGARVGLYPEQGWDAFECLVVVSGRLREAGSGEEIRAGAVLSAWPVREPCVLTAEEEAVVLYISSKPVFHRISQETADLQRLALEVEMKDGYTADHCLRIQNLSAQLARAVGLPPGRLHMLLFGAFLHDVGKVGVPASLLAKPSPLTPEEWEIMKQHPLIGEQLVERTWMKAAAPIVGQHHERWDGRGYPRGLKGEEICLEAQIVAVVDAFDAMTTDRVYRPALPVEEALARLEAGAGSQFSPEVVRVFVEGVRNGTLRV